jgi:hypothetical protein
MDFFEHVGPDAVEIAATHDMQDVNASHDVMNRLEVRVVALPWLVSKELLMPRAYLSQVLVAFLRDPMQVVDGHNPLLLHMQSRI